MDHSSGLVFRRPHPASHRRAVVYFCAAVLRAFVFWIITVVRHDILEPIGIDYDAESMGVIAAWVGLGFLSLNALPWTWSWYL